MTKRKFVRAGEQTEEDSYDENPKPTVEVPPEGMNAEHEAVDHNEAISNTDTDSDSDGSDSDGSGSYSGKSGKNDSNGSGSDSDELRSNDFSSSGSGNETNGIGTNNESTHPSSPDQSLDRTTNGKKNSEDGNAEVHQPSVAKNLSGEADNNRMDRFEKILESMASAMKSFEAYGRPIPNRETEPNWPIDTPSMVPNDTPSMIPIDTPSMVERNPSVIRWDNIKPFPSGIPANKMLEEWNRYIEIFEIAASLNNAQNPVKRTQLLFLSMGPDLQDIVRAAKLYPRLTDVNCYKIFVANIKDYFRTMTDTSAEHEAFSSMRQERNESAIAFHARLMSKVRLCGYSNDDQDRFVKAQLLKGLRNKELVKASRTYGYQTNFIVQAATRDEAYEAETAHSADDHVFQIKRQNTSTNSSQKRRKPDDSFHEPPAKRRQIDQGQGRRSRCSKCNLTFHRNGRCPALDKKCLNCGKLGHFAAACRGKRVNAVRFKQEDIPSDNDDGREDDKQVLKS